MPEASVTEQIDKRLAGMAARYPVEETLTLGIDVGIASCGWALVRAEGGHGEIVAAGAWCFEPPEFPKDRKLKNVTRREKRLLRRVIGRRSRRLQAIRRLLVEHGLLASPDPDAFHNKKEAAAPDPWIARCRGLDTRLDDAEFAAALIHMAKHRGFKSNRKSGRAKTHPMTARC